MAPPLARPGFPNIGRNTNQFSTLATKEGGNKNKKIPRGKLLAAGAGLVGIYGIYQLETLKQDLQGMILSLECYERQLNLSDDTNLDCFLCMDQDELKAAGKDLSWLDISRRFKAFQHQEKGELMELQEVTQKDLLKLLQQKDVHKILLGLEGLAMKVYLKKDAKGLEDNLKMPPPKSYRMHVEAEVMHSEEHGCVAFAKYLAEVGIEYPGACSFQSESQERTVCGMLLG